MKKRMIGLGILITILLTTIVYSYLISDVAVGDCSETDSGFDLGTFGTNTYQNLTTLMYHTVFDICSGTTHILEYECSGSSRLLRYYEECPAGTSCSNGACT